MQLFLSVNNDNQDSVNHTIYNSTNCTANIEVHIPYNITTLVHSHFGRLHQCYQNHSITEWLGMQLTRRKCN